MKRKRSDTEALVYAYGCGDPTDGLAAMEREDSRIRALWDKLVEIDRAYDMRVLMSACADDETLAAAVAELDLRRAMPHVPDDDWPAERKLRRQLESKIWTLLSAWRRTHQDIVRDHECWRRAQVVAARHGSDCYWSNYNAVIARYEAARTEVRKRGRRLRKTDPSRDDGCLTVQIQRTRSGLGASPDELQDGTCWQIQIARVDHDAYDPSTFRGERRRLCRTVVQMRVDAEGNTVTLPVWMHRPLPSDCRVKLAQLVWSRQCGGPRKYKLCLTVSRAKTERPHPRPDSIAVVAIDIGEHGRHLRVARISGHPERDIIMLDEHWLAMMDRVDALAAVIGDDAAGDHARIRARMERPGLWRRLLLRRREQYRLIAREIAMAHGSIVVETPALSELAWTERGTKAAVLRHRACAHELIGELRHQAQKHGAVVDVRISAASAQVPRRVRNRMALRLEQSNSGPLAPNADAA